MVKVLLMTAFIVSATGAAGFFYHPSSFVVFAQDDWKAEFDDICSKTLDPMALSNPELGTLIERCDKLKPRLEKLDETTAKVYLKRLRMCKDLFAFTLEAKSR